MRSARITSPGVSPARAAAARSTVMRSCGTSVRRSTRTSARPRTLTITAAACAPRGASSSRSRPKMRASARRSGRSAVASSRVSSRYRGRSSSEPVSSTTSPASSPRRTRRSPSTRLCSASTSRASARALAAAMRAALTSRIATSPFWWRRSAIRTRSAATRQRARAGGSVDDGILVQEHRGSLQATLRLRDALACREHGGSVPPGDLERARQAERLDRSRARRRQAEKDGGEYELSE